MFSALPSCGSGVELAFAGTAVEFLERFVEVVGHACFPLV